MTITIPVPPDIKLLIKDNQMVDFKTPLWQKVSKNEVTIPVAKDLSIEAGEIFLHLTKVVGEEIKKGELLARKKTILGEKKYLSEYDGVIKEIRHEDGSIVIGTSEDKAVKTLSFFKGEVENASKTEIKLKVKKAEEFELKEASSYFGGEIVFSDESSLPNLNPEDIEGKIICIRSLKPYNVAKLEVMGARGFVSQEALSQKSSLNFAQIKKPSDWETIHSLNLPYCLISKKTTIIYFYQ